MKIRVAISVLIATAQPVALLAAEIHSPYAMNFYAAPDWLPESVTAADTPGADSTVDVQCWTNRVMTEWGLADDSRRYAMGEDCWNGNYPEWSGDVWTGDVVADGHDYGSFVAVVSGSIEPGYDEFTEDVYASGVCDLVEVPSGSPIGSEDFLLHFVRSVSNEIHAVTNIIKRRVTLDTESSFFHTLDGWCEREYFTGLGYGEDYHVLTNAPLQTIGMNRAVTTRRIVGKTNQWAVADRLLQVARDGWRAGFDPGVTNSPYTHPMRPLWSSRTFDDIYGPQLPDEIPWTDEGLYALSNKCAVIRGVTNDTVWAGAGTNGWFYTELFPDDFRYGVTNRYPDPSVPPGHGFGFPRLCAEAFRFVMTDGITNRTLRIESRNQAAVNQAMTVLDRTVGPVTPVGSGSGTERTLTHVSKYSQRWSLDDVGIVYDGDLGAYRIDEDAYIRPALYTNYYETTNTVWNPDPVDSDSIELSGNVMTVDVGAGVSFGSWSIPASVVIAALNEYTRWEGPRGVTGVVYHVWIADVVQRTRDDVTALIAHDIPGMYLSLEPTFPVPTTNGFASASVTVFNSYRLRESGMPEFEVLDHMPMDQAWIRTVHSHVDRCRDVCTASIGVFDHDAEPYGDRTNVYMHCRALSRGRDEFVSVHSNEWVTHDFELRNRIQAVRGIDWAHPELYVTVPEHEVSGVLGSIRVLGDQVIGIQWGHDGVDNAIPVVRDGDGVWSLAAVPFAPRELRLWVDASALTDYDSTAHDVTTRSPVEGKMRTRITSIVDWNFNSIRKKTNE